MWCSLNYFYKYFKMYILYINSAISPHSSIQLDWLQYMLHWLLLILSYLTVVIKFVIQPINENI